MRNPWLHDVDEDRPTTAASVGRRNAVRLGVALWLLVGVAAVGLYLGWAAAPRQYEAGAAEGPTVAGPAAVVESEGGSLTVLLPVGGRHYGFSVDAAGPRATVVLADTAIRVV